MHHPFDHVTLHISPTFAIPISALRQVLRQPVVHCYVLGHSRICVFYFLAIYLSAAYKCLMYWAYEELSCLAHNFHQHCKHEDQSIIHLLYPSYIILNKFCIM